MTAAANETPRLTEDNIFYDGFAKVTPLKTTRNNSFLDFELLAFVPDLPDMIQWDHDATSKTHRLHKQSVALTMVLGKRMDQMNANIEASDRLLAGWLKAIDTNLTQLGETVKGSRDSTVQQQQKGTRLIVQSLKELQTSIEESMKKQSSSGHSTSGGLFSIPLISQPHGASEEKAKSSMMSRLIQNIALIDEKSKEPATSAKLYADMARTGQFDPDAGVTFNQLVAAAKNKGFIVEQTAANGARYLKLAQ